MTSFGGSPTVFILRLVTILLIQLNLCPTKSEKVSDGKFFCGYVFPARWIESIINVIGTLAFLLERIMKESHFSLENFLSQMALVLYAKVEGMECLSIQTEIGLGGYPVHAVPQGSICSVYFYIQEGNMEIGLSLHGEVNVVMYVVEVGEEVLQLFWSISRICCTRNGTSMRTSRPPG